MFQRLQVLPGKVDQFPIQISKLVLWYRVAHERGKVHSCNRSVSEWVATTEMNIHEDTDYPGVGVVGSTHWCWCGGIHTLVCLSDMTNSG